MTGAGCLLRLRPIGLGGVPPTIVAHARCHVVAVGGFFVSAMAGIAHAVCTALVEIRKEVQPYDARIAMEGSS